MSAILVWSIAAGTMAGILFRPRNWSEAVWPSLAALVLVVSGLLRFSQAVRAAAGGADVYLFLAGMMLLSELARCAGVFDWLASIAARAARDSRARLFSLVYLVGIVVTVFLSNDAAAVVLTPAVYAAVQKARMKPLPYLLICAFIANAASFVLPISNPANLVVYGKNLPPLAMWLRIFLAPSICSIAVTYCALRWFLRRELGGTIGDGVEAKPLSRKGRVAAWGILGTGAVLMTASALGVNLGLPACVAAALAVLLTIGGNGRAWSGIVKGVTWSVLPFVAGLFVLVEAINQSGALAKVSGVLQACARMPGFAGPLASAFGVAGLSNVMNNLPSGLLFGAALQKGNITALIRDAVLIGVDLGPNLSITGSLATMLWLIVLRREGVQISGWRFLRIGLIVMPPSLALSIIALSLFSSS